MGGSTCPALEPANELDGSLLYATLSGCVKKSANMTTKSKLNSGVTNVTVAKPVARALAKKYAFDP